MDYSHVHSGQTCDGILYYDDAKKSYVIHAIYTGELFDYKIKNTKEARRIKLSKCHGGIIIDNVPYAFQTKKANAEPTLFNMPGSPSPNVALAILEEVRNDLFTKLSNLQRQFNDYRNLFLSDDDMKIVSKYLAQCEKSLKEMEVKAQNASLLL
jgi:MoxR-like ATPase